jgi:hypothetical protein
MKLQGNRQIKRNSFVFIAKKNGAPKNAASNQTIGLVLQHFSLTSRCCERIFDFCF